MFTVIEFDDTFCYILDRTEMPTAIGAIEHAAHLQAQGSRAGAYLIEGEHFIALDLALVEVEGRIEDAVRTFLTREPRPVVSTSTGI